MRTLLLALGLAAIAAPAATRDRSDTATPNGKPERCIRTNMIRDTHIRNDSVIDFNMGGSKLYRNTLPYACPGLAAADRFLYKTTIGELCSVDTITVLNDPPIGRGATCGLGLFQPMKLAPR